MRAIVLLVFTVLTTVFSASAQPLPPPPPNMAVPLDSVVIVLILASVAFGAYKLRLNKRDLLQKAS